MGIVEMCAKRAICILFALISLGAANADASTSFDFHQESFISPDYGSDVSRSFFFAGLHLQSAPQILTEKDRGSESTFKMDLRAELSSAIEASYINPRELYLQIDSVSVGRKRMNWSTTDQQWRLGLIQPQFRWNPLAPEEQGLVGGFYEHQGANWSFSAFGSPMFLPDQGPGFLLKDGEFKRVSPWFQNQASTVRLTGSEKVRTLDYDVQTPPLDRIILSPGGGLSISVGTEKTSYQVRVSSLYKPANQISLGIDGTAEPKEKAHIFVAPTVFYQFVTSADLIFRNESWEWTLGGVRESVSEPKDQRSGFSYVTYSPMTLASTSVAWKSGLYSVRFGALYRDGGESRTVGVVTNDIAALFSDRIPYKDAASVTLSSEKLWNTLGLSTTYLQGLSSDYAQWSIKADIPIGKQTTIWASTLLITASDRAPMLFRENEDNDSIRFGVNYVF